MENQEMGGMGGGRRRKGGDDDKKKDKQKELPPLRENEKPRNRQYMEDERGKIFIVPDWDDELPPRWDWRKYQGIISNILDQDEEAICWAISLIRAIEALLNIGKKLEQQRTLSIQHLRNSVQYGTTGILEDGLINCHIQEQGVLDEAECSYARTASLCEHGERVERVTIDEIVTISNVDDTTLVQLVRRQPIVAMLPLCTELQAYRKGIYKTPKSMHGLSLGHTHAVLIVGYDIDDFGNAYWIVQNSWGEKWGDKGYGYIYRHTKKGQMSMFTRIKFPVKEGFPEEQKKKKKKK